MREWTLIAVTALGGLGCPALLVAGARAGSGALQVGALGLLAVAILCNAFWAPSRRHRRALAVLAGAGALAGYAAALLT